MATIVVLQHGAVQMPGRLGATLRDHGFKLDIRRLDLGGGRAAGASPALRTDVPTSLEGIHGIVSLGGPQNVDGQHAWIRPELELIRRAHEAELPVIGSCLGHQLIALALGGEVGRLAEPEIGFCRMALSFAGQTDTVLAGVPWGASHFFSHAYGVTKAPAGAVTLASSAKSPCAIMKAGIRTYGFQHHFEADKPMIDAITHEASDLMERAGLTPEELQRQVDAGYEMFARSADRVCLNLATHAFPFHSLLSA